MPRVRRGLLALFLVVAAGLIVFSAKLGNRTDKEDVKPRAGSSAPSKQSGGAKSGKKGKGGKGKAHPIPDSAFFSAAACQAYIAAHPPRAAARAPRVGTWNVRAFPHGKVGGKSDSKKAEQATDVPWLACAIAAMDVDVLAVQEIMQDAEGKKALADLITNLDTLTHGKWHSVLDECSGTNRQHLGFLYDESRVTVSGERPLPALNPGTSACDLNQRPGFAIYAKFPTGTDLHLVAVHLDNGQTKTDYEHRQAVLARLGEVTKELGQAERDSDVLLLGVFNAGGCKECDPRISDHAELATIADLIKGANMHAVGLPKNRSCTEYAGKHTQLFDQVAASADLSELAKGTKIELFGPCADLGCKLPYSSDKVEALDRLSDHCPLVVALAGEDDDPNVAGAAGKPANAAAKKAAGTAVPKTAAPAAAAKTAAPETVKPAPAKPAPATPAPAAQP
jgi:endonuclease/exonuclease/phosphatase family metal-dependent hydrolase